MKISMILCLLALTGCAGRVLTHECKTDSETSSDGRLTITMEACMTITEGPNYTDDAPATDDAPKYPRGK